ncbi:MAG: S8 family serine peptidase [Thermoproteota archaeon]
MRRGKYIVLLLIIVLLTPVNILLLKIDSSKNLSDIALDFISRTYNIPITQLSVENSAFLRLPESGKVLWEAKVIDRVSGNIFMVALNEAGEIVNRTKVINEERLLQDKNYGKLETGLYKKLMESENDELIEVAIWLNDQNLYPSINRNEIINDSSKLKTMLKEASSKIEAIEKPLIDYLQSSGYKITYASKYAPLVYVLMSKKEISKFAYNPISNSLGVNKIFLSRSDYKLMSNSIIYTILAPYVWQKGITGNYNDGSSYVAIVEVDKVCSGNPYIPLAASYNPSGAEGSHATLVAGIVAGQYYNDAGPANDFRGVAPGAYILSANPPSWAESDIVAAVDWAIEQGARITVNSYGAPYNYLDSALVSYYDYLTYNLGITNVISAGNYPNWNTYEVLIPGVARNAITVGAFSDANTPNWDDDYWCWWSCYSDHYPPFQLHGDFNKPEVSSVGERVFSTALIAGDNQEVLAGETAGTSFSAPVVAGVAALLMDRHPVLMYWPEPLKAIMMVSTWHPRIVDYNHSCAGEVIASTADDVANGRIGSFNYWALKESNFTDNKFTLGSFYLHKGEMAKVALVWDSHSLGYGQPDVLASDLDLLVDFPGEGFAMSSSFDNSYEYVEFIAPESGWYTAIAYKFRWDAENYLEYVGYAFSRQPSTIDYIGRNILLAGSNDVYCVLPDLAHAAAVDWSSLGVIYGIMGQEQNIGLDNWNSWVDPSTGRPVVPSGSKIVTIGSAWVNFVVRYYENRDRNNFWNPGSTPVYDQAYVRMNLDGTGNSNHIWFEATPRSTTHSGTIPGTMLTLGELRSGTTDMFVVQSFTDGDNREVLITYGFGWKGSWIATIWLKEQKANNFDMLLSHHWYIIRWNDTNNDKLPQLEELTLIASGD